MDSNRILKIGVEVDGVLRVYEGGDMSVKLNRSADGKQNSCEAVLTNLRPEVRNYLITECSPWNPKPSKKLLTVIAGREGVGEARIFSGGIVSATPSDLPDIRLTLKALVNDDIKYKFVARQSPPTISLSTLAALVAKDYGLPLVFNAKDKTVANYLYNGSAALQANQLALVGDVDVFVDNARLVVKDIGKANRGQARVLSKHTQMIGSPLVDDKGVRVRMLFDPTVNVGDAVAIASEVNPAADGHYVIYNIATSLATRSKDWYLDLSCNNANIRSIQAKREAEAKANAKSASSK